MKFFVAIALFAAAASARILPADLNLSPVELAEVEQIMAAIYSPSTDPTTAVMLEQMLFDLLGLSPAKPPVILPAFIDQFEPVHVGPELIDFPLPEGALAPTPVGPVAPAAPAPPAPSSSPLVQIIVNVKPQGDSASVSPVQVDQIGGPSPVVVVDKPKPVIKPTPVIVVDEAGPSIIKPTPVIVVDQPEIQPEPVLVAQLPEPVIVVDQPEIQPEPILVAQLPEPVIVVDQPEIKPEPVLVAQLPEPVIVVDQPEIQPEPVLVAQLPEPVIVVDQPEIQPEPVLVAQLPEPVLVVDQPEIEPEPVVVAQLPESVVVAPVINTPIVAGPVILN